MFNDMSLPSEKKSLVGPYFQSQSLKLNLTLCSPNYGITIHFMDEAVCHMDRAELLSYSFP